VGHGAMTEKYRADVDKNKQFQGLWISQRGCWYSEANRTREISSSWVADIAGRPSPPFHWTAILQCSKVASSPCLPTFANGLPWLTLSWQLVWSASSSLLQRGSVNGGLREPGHTNH
jgi:hypothetical protein